MPAYVREREVRIAAGDAALGGILEIPDGSRGLVLFAHGSGSGRHSPRNRYVAERLHAAQIGTLLFDLLTEGEEVVDQISGEWRFDIDFLAARLIGTVSWLREQPVARDLRTGYFGASTGAAAALVAAAAKPEGVDAVVSRGGRPDLAGEALPRVRAPTLLIVGGRDKDVIELNESAFEKLQVKKKLELVPGATHLFEEPGALEEVSRLAAGWFEEHFKG